jgi:hypothetical protein
LRITATVSPQSARVVGTSPAVLKNLAVACAAGAVAQR